MNPNPMLEFIDLMESVGLYNLGLALLLVFAVTFGLLESAGIFKSRRINVIVSIVIALFSIYYPPAADIIFYLASRSSLYIVGGFLAIFLVYVLSKVFLAGGDEAEVKESISKVTAKVKIFAAAIGGAIALYLIYTSGVGEMMGLSGLLEYLITLLPPAVIIGGIIYFVYRVVRGPHIERKKEMKQHHENIQKIYRKHYQEMYNYYVKQGYPKELAEKKAKQEAEKLIDKIYL